MIKYRKIIVFLTACLFFFGIGCDMPRNNSNDRKASNFQRNENDLVTASYSPAESEYNVAVDSNIVITFNESMKIDNDWSVSFDGKAYTKAETGNIAWSSENKVLTINPSVNLTDSTNILLTLDGFLAEVDGVALTVTSSKSMIYTCPPYNLRETGPAGGLVFYDKGSYNNGWRFLEAAPASTEWTEKSWGCDTIEIDGADGTAVGTGKQNTAEIVNGCSESDIAARLCYDLEVLNNSITYDNWFLPSQDELNLMYLNLHQSGIGGLTGDYWTSTERNVPYAWYYKMSSGLTGDSNKGAVEYRVRAVRAF